MDSEFNSIVFSKNVIEFVTVANEYCNFIENSEKTEQSDFISKIQKFLPLLYLKASMLTKNETVTEEEPEKYVTEAHYAKINNTLLTKFGELDSYKDLTDSQMNETTEFVEHSISEDLSDIYQDLKDFIYIYRLGDVDIMNDGLWECINNFELYWGNRLLSASKSIHLILYTKSGIDVLTKND
ncbi:MAG: hypothetical protein A2046_04035 [Bacteroidetes bacterium GWA2_30_7]|nr:MAG: hypothetical protein A2046_04035 [Bacteroidetes bacterium GWA2_30_7]